MTPEKEEVARGDLLRQIETSSRELESQLAELRRSAPGNDDRLHNGQAKLHHLNSLRDQLVGGAKGVAALRAEITAAVAATHAYTLSVSGVVGTAQASPAEQAAQAALREASVAAHQTVDNFERDFYGRKIFDPYLKFASTQDEDEYRRREQERQRAIEKAQAENTPEGNLRATKLAIAQLEDAGAHGADRSPDYRRTLDGLKHSERTLDARLSHTPNDKGATERLSLASAPTTKAGIVPPDLADAFRGAGVVVTDPASTGSNAALPAAARAAAAQPGAVSH